MSGFTDSEKNLQLVNDFLDALVDCKVSEWLNLWHENGVQVFPFANNMPDRLSGKSELYEHYKNLSASSKPSFSSVKLSVLREPEWIMAEYQGCISSPGESEDTFYSIFRVLDEKVQLFCEYTNVATLLSLITEANGG